MKMINDLVEAIDEELESAKCYAERFVMDKLNGKIGSANKYKEMAADELKHAMYLHDEAMDKISEFKNQGYEAPAAMDDIWSKEHKLYIEKVALTKQILSM